MIHTPVIQRHRQTLLLVHIICAITSGLFLLSLEQSPVNLVQRRLLCWRFGCAQGLFAAAPAMWPFLVSHFAARNRVVERASSLVAFWLILLGGTLVGCWLLYVAGEDSRLAALVLISIGQSIVFSGVAEVLGGIVDRERVKEHGSS